MSNNNKKYRSIKYGDPRVFFESTTTKPVKMPNGIEYPVGAIVRGSTFVDISANQVSLSLPSMAELIFFQSKRDLDKAESIKARALKTTVIPSGTHHLCEEDLFYTYMQLLSVGVLGLYSSLESMVYELYIRKNKEKKVKIDGKELTASEFTAKGFVTKVTKFASQLSGKPSIYGTELMEKVNEVNRLRTSIQHWDLEQREDYFLNLPDNHPLKVFVNVSPSQLADNIRMVLDYYSLKDSPDSQQTTDKPNK